MVVIKNTNVLSSLLVHPFDPKLIDVICWFVDRNSDEDVVITEGFRLQKHKNDLHGLTPVRAIDFRSHRYLSPMQIKDDVNSFWEYDYNRPHMDVCVLHTIKGGSEHFHLQVHPHTRKRKSILVD